MQRASWTVGRQATLGLALLGMTFVACSCDDDDGPGDAGMDGTGGMLDGTGGTTRPRVDGGEQQQGTPLTECAPETGGCAGDDTCALLVRRPLGSTSSYTVQYGCVDTDKSRGEGAPCLPFDVAYTHPGSDDEILLDPCAEGLMCAPDRGVAGLYTCQTSCRTGLYVGFPPNPCGDDSYCTGFAPPEDNPYFEWCVEAADCDPILPDACGGGSGCYPRFTDDGTGVLTECYRTTNEVTADYAPCEFINECAPGSICWGSALASPIDWTDESRLCRPVCIPGAAPADAGMDEDAGASGPCPAGTTCVAFSEGPLSLEQVSVTLGHCE